MLLTGGFTEGRGVVWGSVAVESSDQIYPLSSDISTNSRAMILFTTFGGRVAAGLYGPAAWSAAETGGAGSLSPDLPSCCSLAHNPNPPILGWLQPPMPVQWVQPTQFQHSPAASQRPTPAREVCRSYNLNHCRFSRCRYAHVCSECGGAHTAPSCPSPRQLPDRFRVRGSPHGTELPVATPAPRPRARSTGPPFSTVPSEPGTPLSTHPGRRRTRTAAPVNSARRNGGSSVYS